MNKMLKQFILFTGFSSSMLATAVSLAVSIDGCYVSGDVTTNWLKTQTYKIQASDDVPLGTTVALRSKTGWSGGLAVGSQSGPYRLEAALDFLSNKTKNGTAAVSETWWSADPVLLPLSTSGRVTATTLLINGYYDLKPAAMWTPYVGVGLGVANFSVNVSAVQVDPFSFETFAKTHDNSTEFAYQGIAGLAWKVTNHVKASLDYRYLHTATATFNVTHQLSFFSRPGVAVVKSHYESNRAVGSLAYYFD